jgi:hypothetical protein
MVDAGHMVIDDKFRHDFCIWLMMHARTYDGLADRMQSYGAHEHHHAYSTLHQAALAKAKTIRDLIDDVSQTFPRSRWGDAEYAVVGYIHGDAVENTYPMMQNPNDSDTTPK